jgi:LVIVD repeat-containing protein
VKSKYATAVALPTTMPVSPSRQERPAFVKHKETNQEQPMHPLYRYAYVTDKYEGLIVVDVETLSDGDPDNNFLKRSVTFNPNGILDGAVNLTVAGVYAYIACSRGLVIVSLENPLDPRVVAEIAAPALKSPAAIAVQFRYAFVLDTEGLKVIDVTFPERPRTVDGAVVPIADAHDIYVERGYAYIAAGSQGLVIVDIERPEKPRLDQVFTADGQINDARGVRVGSTNASLFAYIADGKNGLRVLQLTSPVTQPNYYGFNPKPVPQLIASYKTLGPAIALSKGLDRDRAVDESGNQVSVFGRLGSRPFTLEEQQRMYLRKGEVYTVTNDPPSRH